MASPNILTNQETIAELISVMESARDEGERNCQDLVQIHVGHIAATIEVLKQVQPATEPENERLRALLTRSLSAFSFDTDGRLSDTRIAIEEAIGQTATVEPPADPCRALLLEAEGFVREDQKDLRQRIADALHGGPQAEPSARTKCESEDCDNAAVICNDCCRLNYSEY